MPRTFLKKSVNHSFPIIGALVVIGVIALAAPGVAQGQGGAIASGLGGLGGLYSGYILTIFFPFFMLVNALGFLLFSLVLAVFLAMIQMDITAFMGTGQAVDTVWRLLRDLSNMFFIIVLIVIAFGTMLRMESYKWQRLIPKLAAMAILINFSKTIALIILDAAHLLMMTFVNAFKDIAVDNIITGTRIIEPYKNISFGADGITGLLSTVMTSIMIFAVALVLVVILLLVMFRVVLLWIFIAISPIAYVTDIIDATSKYARKWWDTYIKLVLFGPMLAFFLWFALMFMSGGSGVLPEDALKDEGSYGGVTDSNNFANFLIGTILLIVGTSMAVSSAQYGGKVAGRVFDAGKGKFKQFINEGAPGMRGWAATNVASTLARRGGQVLGKIPRFKKVGEWASADDRKGNFLSAKEFLKRKVVESDKMKDILKNLRDPDKRKEVGILDKSLAFAIASLGRALAAFNSKKIIQRFSPAGLKGAIGAVQHRYRTSEIEGEQEGAGTNEDYMTAQGLWRAGQRVFTIDGLIGNIEFSEQELNDLKERFEKGNFGAAADEILQKYKKQYEDQDSKQAEDREKKWGDGGYSALTPDKISSLSPTDQAELQALGTKYKTLLEKMLKDANLDSNSVQALIDGGAKFKDIGSIEWKKMTEALKNEIDKEATESLKTKKDKLDEKFATADGKKELVLGFVNSELAGKRGARDAIIGDGGGALQTMEEISSKNDAINSSIQKSNELIGKLLSKDSLDDKNKPLFKKQLLELKKIEDELGDLGGDKLKLDDVTRRALKLDDVAEDADDSIFEGVRGILKRNPSQRVFVEDKYKDRGKVFEDAKESSKAFTNIQSDYGSSEQMLRQRKLLEDASGIREFGETKAGITTAKTDALPDLIKTIQAKGLAGADKDEWDKIFGMYGSEFAKIDELEGKYLKFLSKDDFDRSKKNGGARYDALEEIFQDSGAEFLRLQKKHDDIIARKEGTDFQSIYQFSDAQFKKEDGTPDKKRAEEERKKRIKVKEQLDREIKVTTKIVTEDIMRGGLTPAEQEALKRQMQKKKQQIDDMKANVLSMRSEGEYYRREAAQRGMAEEFKHVENIEDSEELCDIYRSALASRDKYMAMAALKKLTMTYNENDILCKMGYPARSEGLNQFVQDTMIRDLGMDEQEALGFQSDFAYMAEDRNHWGVARSVGSKYGKLVQKTPVEQAKAVAGELMKRQPMDVLQGLNRLGWGGEGPNYEGYQLGLYALPVLKAIASSIPWALQRGQFNTNAVFHLFGRPEIRAQIQGAGIEDIAKNPAVRASLNQLLRSQIREGELQPFITREVMKQLDQHRG